MKYPLPKCTKGKYHNWKDSGKIWGESQICAKCGYDRVDFRYRTKERINTDKQKHKITSEPIRVGDIILTSRGNKVRIREIMPHVIVVEPLDSSKSYKDSCLQRYIYDKTTGAIVDNLTLLKKT